MTAPEYETHKLGSNGALCGEPRTSVNWGIWRSTIITSLVTCKKCKRILLHERGDDD